MKETRPRRVVSLLLCVMMVLSLMPIAAFASASFTQSQLSVVSDKQSKLADGVTQDIYTVYDKNGKQVKMFAATVDPSVDTVKMFTSYKDMDNTSYGMSKLTEQVAAFDKKAAEGDEYYTGTVVAGINASYYNMTTGKPSGVFVMNGNDVTGNERSAYFAVMKDGSVKIGTASDYDSDKGNIQEAIGIYKMLVNDGNIVLSEADQSSTQKYPRQTIGITADGKVILLSADGNNEPTSAGLTLMEQAQVMLDLGCVYAGHLDGGGSMTYGSKPEGEDTFRIINTPSDGSERTVSSGFIVVSTAEQSNVFDHAILTADNDYVTPGSTVNFSAIGVSPTGGSAELPENATWALADSKYGTISDGVFVSNGTAGDVTVYLKVEDTVVGEATIHVLVPTTLDLSLESMYVSYGNTKELEVTAYTADGRNKIALKDGDVALSLSDEALGTVSGLSFTAAQVGATVTTGTITAYFVGHEDVTDTLTVTLTDLPDAPVVFEDFEGDVKYTVDPMWPEDYISYTTEVVDSTTGKVHDGNKALAITLNGQSFGLNQYSGGYCLGYGKAGADGTIDQKVSLVGAKKLGLWIYIPEDSAMMYPQIRFRKKENTSVQVQHRLYDVGYATTESGHTGWQYFEVDLQNPNDSGRAVTENYDLGDGTWYIEGFEIFTNSRTDNPHNTEYNYNVNSQQSAHGPCTFYIDTFTVEYFDNNVDRENPTFNYVKASYGGMSDAVSVNGQTITTNVVSFTAKASDASAFDVDSAKAYIDGNLVSSTFDSTTGIITIDDTKLTDGVHTVKFEVSDIYGNSNYVVRQLTVNAGSDAPTARLINTNTASYPRYNTVIWFNLEVDQIEKVQTVSMKLNANTTSKWELDNISCIYGFTSSYTIDKITNTATITITRTGDVEKTGTAVLAEIPLRMGTYTASNKLYPLDMKLSMEQGKVTYTDGEAMFSMADVDIDSEVYGWTSQANKDIHKTHTGTALANKAATCTEEGYTGRTYCDICNSVVDWGTTIPATGHTYAIADGTVKCSECGHLFNGEWTDGKTYVDGLLVADGWNGDSYYKDGAKLTGLQIIDGYYYNFGKDGVCANQAKLDGFFFDESINAYRYFAAGIMMTGDVSIYPEAYFFDASGVAISGQVDVLGYSCYFSEKGAFISSDDSAVIDAGYSGTNIQYVLLDDGTLIVDGDGAIKDYNASGSHPAWIVQNDDKAITSLVIGNRITKIGKFCFFRTPYLKTVKFEENSSLETIGWGAFGHCWRLTGVTLPSSVITLDSYAFYECGAMTYVDFEEDSKLSTINYGAFLHGLSLESVFIPDTVTEIGSDVFYNANSNLVLKVAEGSVGHSYAVKNNITFELRKGATVAIEEGIVNDDINWILYSDGTLMLSGAGAMPNYSSYAQQPWANYRDQIKKVVIGKDITTVGNYAFAYCQNNTAVEFEEGSQITTIGVLAFFNNPKLTEIVLPETTTYISAYAFGDCFELTNVYVPQSVSGIYATAFTNSTKVVLNVATGSFAESFAKEQGINYTTRDFVYTPIGSGSCGENATWEMYENGELWIKGSGAMNNYKSHSEQPWANYRDQIKKVVIGKDITTVGNYAFAYCQNNTAVEFEEGSQITTIGVLAFFNNPKLTEIVLPETTTYISAYAFGDCFELTNVYVPQSVSGIYATAFTNSTKVVLNVATGSFAESFAKEQGINYTVLIS